MNVKGLRYVMLTLIIIPILDSSERFQFAIISDLHNTRRPGVWDI